MRILRLLLSLVFIVSGATPILASLGVASQCVPPAIRGATEAAATSSPLPRFGRVRQAYTTEDRDYLIRTIAFEANNEPDEGKAAVAHVILNRAKSGRWGDSIKDVVMHPWQFEPWMTRRREMKRLSADDSRYRKAAEIADALFSGQMPDPTAGATHFLNPTIVRKRRGGSLPSWARGDGQQIGRHTFYRPEEGSVARERTILSTGAFGDAASCSHLEAGEAPHIG